MLNRYPPLPTQSILNEKTQLIYEKDLLGISHIKEANINLICIGARAAADFTD